MASLSIAAIFANNQGYSLAPLPVQTQDSEKRLFEAEVSKGVTRRVDGAVDVAQPEEEGVDAAVDVVSSRHKQDGCLVGRPAQDERSENKRYLFKSFSGVVNGSNSIASNSSRC